MSLPPPTTFAEGERLVYGRLAAGFGGFCALMSIGLVGLLMWGGWDKGEQHTIVLTLGGTLIGFIAGMITVMVGLLVGGPVGRFKGEVDYGQTKVSVEADTDGGTNGAN